MTAPALTVCAVDVLDAAQSALENNLSGYLATLNAEHGTSLVVPTRYRRSELIHRDYASPEIALYTISERLASRDGLFAYDVEQRFAARVTLSAVGQAADTETELWNSLAVYAWAVAYTVQLHQPSETGSPVYVCDPVSMTPSQPAPLGRNNNQWIQSETIEFLARYRARHIEV